MHDDTLPYDDTQWIIWNGSLGIRDFVTIGRIEVEAGKRVAWLEEPYDMVGPFNLDTLETDGLIGFAACTVMSRGRWRDDRERLREEAYRKRLEAERELNEELHRFNKRKQRMGAFAGYAEREHRDVLCLPAEGTLEPAQIKAAYRKLARTAHPDVGGSHELFIRIAEARDVLLECYS